MIPLITAVSLREHENSMADCAAALQNIQLAATSLGLGSCWSNQLYWLTSVPAIRKIFKRLGFRKDEDIYGCISVGYPKYVGENVIPRKPGRIVLDMPRIL
jgi:nitroreductase